MTTRSSRFFVVLVHLVGVSTHVPSWKSGIVGVNPLSIVLETLDPSSLSSDHWDGDHDPSRRTEARMQILYDQPHWLQDVLGDQACLDPMGGFSECGDATLWMVIPKRSSRRQARWRKWITWATEEEETEENTSGSRIQGYALQLYDDSHQQQPQPQQSAPKEVSGLADFVSSLASSSFVNTYNNYHSTSPFEELAKKECLTRRRKDNQLVLVPCSEERAWAWHFTKHGILHFKKPKNISKLGRSQDGKDFKPEKQKRLQSKHSKKTLECLGRNASHAAVLTPCSGSDTPYTSEALAADSQRVVQIGLVRQATTDSLFGPISSSSQDQSEVENQDDSRTEPDIVRFPPSPFDIAHSHASISNQRKGTKVTSRPFSFSAKSSSSSTSNAEATIALPLTYFKNTNPILLATGHVGPPGGNPKSTEEAKDAKKKSSILAVSEKKSTASVGKLSTSKPSSSSPSSSKPVLRKIQTNHYITESQDEKWTDPQTGLIYHTDLCKYLGHDRKEVGRHTITGVGQYMKTVFNIKVYGVAFYVSKRDLLADPTMDRYASMTTEELRNEPDFYETLRFMAPSTNPHAGNFDRTLFLKTNMQLATDTMRSSLDADWRMLTQEAKDLLIGSSMKARPASDSMMAVIQSPDNPSKCSCAQVAPEEYGADPACCARGTELVFTWRKTGSLEVRLNGELIDSFDRPDIAAAIFYEYLRLDEPMSFDFLDHVVDGFPMLLGPLSQVKGVGSPGLGQSSSTTAPQQKSTGSQSPFTKAIEGVSEAVFSGASNVAGMMQHGVNEMSTGAMTAARSIGDAARNVGEEMERRRELIGKHVSHFAHHTISSLYSGGKDQKAVAALPKWLESIPFNMPIDLDDRIEAHRRRRLFQNSPFLTSLFGSHPSDLTGGNPASAPDEIVPMIHPSSNHSTQQMFLGMVHMYLLLILIVSFPANLTTRTKLTRKSKGSVLVVQPMSDSSDSDEGSLTEYNGHDKKKSDLRPSKSSSKSGINRGFRTLATKRPYRSSNL